MPMVIRPGRDSDSASVIALIDACWSLYPGVRMDVDGEVPELRALATYYDGQGGKFLVAEDGGVIRGLIATRPMIDDGPSTWEICKVYVDPTLHSGGLGHALLDAAEGCARAGGAEHLVLWSDTRFDRAHRFYEKRSYVRSGPIRVLQDISNSLEFRYAKPVSGVATLDVAAASSAVHPLTGVLAACVDAGDAVGFLAPFAAEQGRQSWDRVALDVGSGKRCIVAAWDDGELIGAATASLHASPTLAHVAEIDRVLVHPKARGRGHGRNLLTALQAEATAAGWTLLTLRMPIDAAGARLCSALGFASLGQIPAYERDARGVLRDGAVFWKALG